MGRSSSVPPLNSPLLTTNKVLFGVNRSSRLDTSASKTTCVSLWPTGHRLTPTGCGKNCHHDKLDRQLATTRASSGWSVRLEWALTAAARSDGQSTHHARRVPAATVQRRAVDAPVVARRLRATTARHDPPGGRRPGRRRAGTVYDADARWPLVDSLLTNQLARATRRGWHCSTWRWRPRRLTTSTVVENVSVAQLVPQTPHQPRPHLSPVFRVVVLSTTHHIALNFIAMYIHAGVISAGTVLRRSHAYFFGGNVGPKLHSSCSRNCVLLFLQKLCHQRCCFCLKYVTNRFSAGASLQTPWGGSLHRSPDQIS